MMTCHSKESVMPVTKRFIRDEANKLISQLEDWFNRYDLLDEFEDSIDYITQQLEDWYGREEE